MDRFVTLNKYYTNDDNDYEIHIPNILWIVPRDIKVWYKSLLDDINGTDSEIVLCYLQEYYENFERLLYIEKHHEHENNLIKIIINVIIDIYDMCCENRGIVEIIE